VQLGIVGRAAAQRLLDESGAETEPAGERHRLGDRLDALPTIN
jgi:hypothetical protein